MQRFNNVVSYRFKKLSGDLTDAKQNSPLFADWLFCHIMFSEFSHDLAIKLGSQPQVSSAS